MASAVVSSSSSRYPWQQQTSKTSFFCQHSNPFISLSFPHSPSPITYSRPSNRFVYLCRTPANHNTPPKALSASQPIKSPDIIGFNSFKLLFHSQSLWCRIFFTSKKVRAIVLLNVITIVYASDIPVLKEVEEFMDPATFNVVRFSLSAIPFLPAAFEARNDAHICKAGAELGLWVSLAYLLQAFGLLTSDAGRASFISMIGVIVIPLLGGMFGSVIPPLTWFGAILSVIGVTMLESSGSPPSVGDLFNLLSAIFFGIHMLKTQQISRTTTKENFIPLLGYEVCVVATSSIIWFLFEGWFDESHRPWTWELFWASWVSFPWIPAIYTGVFSGICLWVEMAAVQEVSATEAAIIYGLEPIWGACFAWFLLCERWGINGWIGAALVLGGSLIAQTFGSLSSAESGDSEQ